MNDQEIQRKLGIPPGETLAKLVALAEKVSPKAPWDSFELLSLSLSWLKPGASAREMRHGTPRNVHPFAETGGDLHHFGFLMDGDLSTDQRPIVSVDPKDDDDATQIVAPSLRDFLGLVATSFAEVVSRRATDDDWVQFRKQWYGDDPTRLREMEHLSNLLCSIPGVVRPSSPSKVANSYPDQSFRLVFQGENEAEDEGGQETRSADFKNNLSDAQQASAFAQRAVEERRFDEAILHARSGMQHPAHRPRCLYVLATAYQRAGQKSAAKGTTQELLKAWLDPSSISPPGVHPRKAIDREELISLLKLVEGGHAVPMIKRIQETPDLDEPGGDFL